MGRWGQEFPQFVGGARTCVHDGDPIVVAFVDTGLRLAFQHDPDGNVEGPVSTAARTSSVRSRGARPVPSPPRRAGADHVGGASRAPRQPGAAVTSLSGRLAFVSTAAR